MNQAKIDHYYFLFEVLTNSQLRFFLALGFSKDCCYCNCCDRQSQLWREEQRVVEARVCELVNICLDSLFVPTWTCHRHALLFFRKEILFTDLQVFLDNLGQLTTFWFRTEGE